MNLLTYFPVYSCEVCEILIKEKNVSVSSLLALLCCQVSFGVKQFDMRARFGSQVTIATLSFHRHRPLCLCLALLFIFPSKDHSQSWVKVFFIKQLFGWRTFPLTQPASHLWFRDGIRWNHCEGPAVFLLPGTGCKDSLTKFKIYLLQALICSPQCGKRVLHLLYGAEGAVCFVPPALLLFHWCKDGGNTCSVPHEADSITGLITDRIFFLPLPEAQLKNTKLDVPRLLWGLGAILGCNPVEQKLVWLDRIHEPEGTELCGCSLHSYYHNLLWGCTFCPPSDNNGAKKLLWYVQMKPRRVHMVQTNARSQTIAVQTLCFFSLDWTSKSWHS